MLPVKKNTENGENASNFLRAAWWLLVFFFFLRSLRPITGGEMGLVGGWRSILWPEVCAEAAQWPAG